MSIFSTISNIKNKATVIGKVVSNKQNIEEAQELKDDVVAFIDKTTKFAKKMSEDQRFLNLAEHFGVNISDHIVSGNKTNVVTNYMKNKLAIRLVIPYNLVKQNQMNFNFVKDKIPELKDLDKEAIVTKLKTTHIQVGSSRFNMVDNELTKSYETELNQPQWLGNSHLSLYTTALLREHKSKDGKLKKLSIWINAKLVNNQTNAIVMEAMEELPLNEIKFNVESNNAFIHAELPQILNHHLSVNEENHLVLHFVLA